MVYTEDKNLTFNMECIMRWWLLDPRSIIKGPKNTIVDVLSRLDLVFSPSNVQDGGLLWAQQG